MERGCFFRDYVGPLDLIEGIMDAKYFTDLMKNYMLTHDKVTSKAAKNWFTFNKVRDLDWPSQSPDLNPIENFWEKLDRQVREENFTNKKGLFASLHQKWKNMPIDKLIKLVGSMTQRYSAFITSKGYVTKN